MKNTKMVALVSLLLVAVFAFSAVAYAATWTTRYSNYLLRRNSDVSPYKRNLQTDLNKYGRYGLIVDGIMGAETERRVKDFQSDWGHQYIDGIVGDATKEDLYWVYEH
jgi:peptidoglycan hydrolase-like protein with peptidoglycan-binding domain